MKFSDTTSGNQVSNTSKPYRSASELDMRESIDRWGRAKWPNARVVHELVMNRGSVRADMAFISPSKIVAIEIKSEFDNMDRILNQVAMFRLAVPELWVFYRGRHRQEISLIHYLIPTIGVGTILKTPDTDEADPVKEEEKAEEFVPWPEATLSLLWTHELTEELIRAGISVKGNPPHAKLVEKMLTLSKADQMTAVCRQLRGRKMLWKSDPPIDPVSGEIRIDSKE